MFKLGEMFVAFVGKDGGLAQSMKRAEGLGKMVFATFNNMIAAGGKMGVAGAQAFGKIGVAAAKASTIISKSLERIITTGLKVGAKVAPSVIKGFDRIIGHGTKLTTGVLNSFTQLGVGAMKSGSTLGAALMKNIGGGMKSAQKATDSGAKGMVGSLFLVQLAANATWAAITGGISLLINAASAMYNFGAGALMAASDTQEVGAKFDVVFGAKAPEAREKLAKLGNALGRSRNELAAMASGIQDLLVPMGFARDKAADMSVKVSQLAVDIASFNNKADSEVVDDISAAMTGSGEVMKKYGVVLNEATLKQELLSMGFKGSAEDAQENLKALARLNIIIKGTSDAHGDAQRTGGSFANVMKRIMGVINEISVQIGAIFLPAAESIGEFFAKHAANLRDNIGETDAWGDTLKYWVDTILVGMDALIVLVTQWGEVSKGVWKLAEVGAVTFYNAVNTIFENISTNIGAFINNAVAFFPALVSSIAETHGTLWDFMKKGWAEIWDFIRSGGTNAIDVGLDKMLASVKSKMQGVKFKPFDTADLNKEWGRFSADLYGRVKQAGEKVEKLDPLKPFKAADAGITVKAKIKFEMTEAAGFWKKALEDAFGKDSEKEGLGLQKEAVRLAETTSGTLTSVEKKLGETLDKLTMPVLT